MPAGEPSQSVAVGRRVSAGPVAPAAMRRLLLCCRGDPARCVADATPQGKFTVGRALCLPAWPLAGMGCGR